MLIKPEDIIGVTILNVEGMMIAGVALAGDHQEQLPLQYPANIVKGRGKNEISGQEEVVTFLQPLFGRPQEANIKVEKVLYYYEITEPKLIAIYVDFINKELLEEKKEAGSPIIHLV